MSQITMFFTSIGVSILFGVLISLYLRKPLHSLLVDICGTTDRAKFWLHITILCYLLVSAVIGLNYQPNFGQVSLTGDTDYGMLALGESQVIFGLGRHLGRTLLGLLLTTGVMAFTISIFIRRQRPVTPKISQG